MARVTPPRTAAQVGSPGQADGVVTGQAALDELVALLDLEQLELNLFRGISPPHSPTRVFGGQVAGQALVAAGRTVEPERAVHSLHSYFLRPGDPQVPIVFDVERVRDGRSFTTRRVRAVQHGEVIFTLGASFQLPQPGVEHAEPAPTGVPAPEDLPDLGEWLRGERTFLSGVPRPLDLRFVEAPLWTSRRGPATDQPQRVWMRADGTLPRRPDAARLPAHLRQRPHTARVGARPAPDAHEPGRAGEPGPRDVVPPPVPRRRVAALRVPLAERLGVTRARDGPVLHARRPAGGDGGAGGDGAGPGRGRRRRR